MFIRFCDAKEYFINNDIVTTDGFRWYDSMFTIDLDQTVRIGEYVFKSESIKEKLTEEQWRLMTCDVTQIFLT